MKRLLSTLALTAVALTSTTAHAKPKKDAVTATGTYGCAKFDANHNGILEPEEASALRKAFEEGETALKPLDVNNDGKLDDTEVAAVKLPAPEGEKKKKKKDSQ